MGDVSMLTMAALARTRSLRGEGGGAGGMTSSVIRRPKLPPATRVPKRGGICAEDTLLATLDAWDAGLCNVTCKRASSASGTERKLPPPKGPARTGAPAAVRDATERYVRAPVVTGVLRPDVRRLPARLRRTEVVSRGEGHGV